MRSIRPACVLLLGFTLLLGAAYPLLVTLMVTPIAPAGDESTGREFTGLKYFWGRPSATTPAYNAAASSASNRGVNDPAFKAQLKERMAVLRAADPGNKAPIPIDLVTASGSGLDPHISPQAARYQAARIARTRSIKVDEVYAIIQKHTEAPQLGVLGMPRVNVLRLNQALDEKIASGIGD